MQRERVLASVARTVGAAACLLALVAQGGCPMTPERPGPASPGAAASDAPGGREDNVDDDASPRDSVDAHARGLPAGPVGAGGNHGIRLFDEAKRELAHIYVAAGPRVDLYCGCSFLPTPGHAMRVDLAACGYVAAKDQARAERIEWEHAVPASAFGHTFAEWRDGDPKCVDGHGRKFRGRKCARLASAEFARIEADLHNLFPVVGEVNALRSDLPMGVMDSTRPPARATAATSFRFGACGSAIERGVFLPRREVRGDLARAYKYMDRSYPERHLIDEPHRVLFNAWDVADPPDAWERERNRRIAARQGNANGFIGDGQ